MGMKASNKIATFFKYFVLILVGVIMIYPLLWMISATFKDNSEIFAGISLWIKKPTLDGYRNALNNFGGSINILQAMLNTYSYVLPKVICTVVSACIAAYGFGRFDFPGRKLLFNIMLATLFLPQVVLNVPQYLLYNKFGWVDSPFYLAIWVHCAFATETYFVYQLVQFCATSRVIWTRLPPLTAAPPSRPCTRSSCPCWDPLWCPAHCSSSCGAATTLWARCFTSAPPASTPCPCSSSCPWTVIPALLGTRSLLCPSSPSCRS